MQRQSLVPLHSFMQGRGRQGAATKMLEVACGTGRFATFVKVTALLNLLLFLSWCDSPCLHACVAVCLHVFVWLLSVFGSVFLDAQVQFAALPCPVLSSWGTLHVDLAIVYTALSCRQAIRRMYFIARVNHFDWLMPTNSCHISRPAHVEAVLTSSGHNVEHFALLC